MTYLNAGISFASAVILAFLTYDLYRRYQRYQGTHRHLLFWAAGLGMFGIASLCDGILFITWNELAFIGWYLFGAILNAAWIGEGTLFLLVRKKWVAATTVVLALASIVTLVILLSTPLNAAAYTSGIPITEQYQSILPKDAVVRRLTPLFNIYGTLLLAGGAAYSGYLFYRKRILPNRVLGNVLIAAASLAVAGAGILNRFGMGQFHSFAQLFFAILMYWGFILASKPAATQPGETPSAAQPLRAK
ncbi:MAG: hypothetical protein B6D41_05765 [Chloroflexi bacterium UTCFX4]|nr:MAG: hypothetical protein B6D41_05765 [Chloroflexi bacterium UTCFX4]